MSLKMTRKSSQSLFSPISRLREASHVAPKSPGSAVDSKMKAVRNLPFVLLESSRVLSTFSIKRRRQIMKRKRMLDSKNFSSY